MKFAHLADCHIGAWREPSLGDLSTTAFEKAIDICIEKKVDFVLIAGDLFNTSLPSFDSLNRATKKLKQLHNSNIPVYMIAGSHDFSPSGKTMLDVLESAGLAANVVKGNIENEKLVLKFTIDRKTGAKITGMLGKKGGLEKNYYAALDLGSLEKEEGYKIFLFHTLLTELKPSSLENAESEPLSLLPKHFDYYAGGHPHFVFSEKTENYGIISYPGPLFPNNFKELEELHHGGFFIVENGKTEHIPIIIYDVESINANAEHKTPEDVESEIRGQIEKKEIRNKIITIRVEGTLDRGKPSDINFHEIFSLLKEKGAYAILKNTSAFTSKEFEDVKVSIGSSDEIEEKLISETITKDDLEGIDAKELAKSLIKVLDTQRNEGETVATFEKRVKEEIERIIQ